MTPTWFIKFRLISLIILASAAGVTSANADVVASLDLPAACAADTKASLQQQVYGLTRQYAGNAWNLVEMFLCADKKSAYRTFEKARSESIIFRIAAPTGVEEKPVTDITQELQQQLPAGKAWGPSVRKEEQDLVVYYSISDTCWDFFWAAIHRKEVATRNTGRWM